MEIACGLSITRLRILFFALALVRDPAECDFLEASRRAGRADHVLDASMIGKARPAHPGLETPVLTLPLRHFDTVSLSIQIGRPVARPTFRSGTLLRRWSITRWSHDAVRWVGTGLASIATINADKFALSSSATATKRSEVGPKTILPGVAAVETP